MHPIQMVSIHMWESPKTFQIKTHELCCSVVPPSVEVFDPQMHEGWMNDFRDFLTDDFIVSVFLIKVQFPSSVSLGHQISIFN